MKKGQCPKCESREVYSGKDISMKRGAYGSNSVPITFMAGAPKDNYVCLNCGYVESYITREKDFEKIKKKWPQVM